jgi:hypothetical protein
MQLSDISQLDLFFLSHLVDEALKTHGDAIHDLVAATEGPHWRDTYQTKTTAYRSAVTGVIKEETEASQAVSEQNAMRDKILTCRRHLEAIARRERDPAQQNLLLRAAGWGLGTPRSVKEIKDFLVTMGASVQASKDRFLALGARPEAVTFAHAMLTRLEAATATTMKELADVKVARADLQSAYAAMVEQVRMVDTVAVAAREGAILVDDEPARAKADALLALLDQAVAQARVEARKKAATETIPPDLTCLSPQPLLESCL